MGESAGAVFLSGAKIADVGIVRSHARSLLFLLATFNAACGQPQEARPVKQETNKMTSDDDEAAQFDRIVEKLWDNAENVRETGMKDLAEFQRNTKAVPLPI